VLLVPAGTTVTADPQGVPAVAATRDPAVADGVFDEFDLVLAGQLLHQLRVRVHGLLLWSLALFRSETIMGA
jgi:hypothetical protein